ncbi:hypothetical protein DACRYDRAFT_112591 [Dacryopinax primogenitus]|uniref:DUF6533 domain-containing protein n=1 Tax=Dacryopinax primogenitus (strain DJM 731) TaxID=1858805 RepID=M5FTU6_DACPD|nr:uncharacterized protein DACRYDRAFT_112591 [Dacryopinax primogenitus]EJT96641.1 hypothetical protein DACRYDRAFT_112591 [Dacryopinax primogenitus]
MDSGALLESLEHAQQGRFVTVASLCLVLHDHFFTCRQEWKFIWVGFPTETPSENVDVRGKIRKWSFSKVLFFLSRYGTLGILLFDLHVALNGGQSDKLYVSTWMVDGVLRNIQLHDLVLFPILERILQRVHHRRQTSYLRSPDETNKCSAVLIFRIYAMYHGDKKIMYFLGLLFVCQLGVMAYVLQAGCRALRAVAEPFPGVQECTVIQTISYEFAYWVALLLFETLLFLLSLRKAHQHIRAYTFRFDDLLLSRRVGEVLIRDGVMYFPFIFLSYLANLVLFAVSPLYLAQVAPHLALALRSVLTNRLLLNVSRKFYYPNPVEPSQSQTGKDSVLGVIVWVSPVRPEAELPLDPEQERDVDSRAEGRHVAFAQSADDLQDADERLGVHLPVERERPPSRNVQAAEGDTPDRVWEAL